MRARGVNARCAEAGAVGAPQRRHRLARAFRPRAIPHGPHVLRESSRNNGGSVSRSRRNAADLRLNLVREARQVVGNSVAKASDVGMRFRGRGL
jgi:hypothetical protein